MNPRFCVDVVILVHRHLLVVANGSWQHRAHRRVRSLSRSGHWRSPADSVLSAGMAAGAVWQFCDCPAGHPRPSGPARLADGKLVADRF